jgi:hypothetical protein
MGVWYYKLNSILNIKCKRVDSSGLERTPVAGHFENCNETSASAKRSEFIGKLSDYQVVNYEWNW